MEIAQVGLGIENGKYGVARKIDEAEAKKLPNQRLLDPGSTPENLREKALGIGCPMPTRVCTRETAGALRALAAPMFGNPIMYSPDSLEVGEARNEIVRMALEDKIEWLFFLDYDVVPPPNALVKLLSLETPISSGVYHLKQVPTYPLIMVRGWPWAFEDYEVGDLIKVDGVGMGCCLINMEVFEKIDPPWFKTVPGYSKDGSTILPHLTEDIYFCDKVREAGYDIIVDTSIQAGHVDSQRGIIYHMTSDSRDSRKPVPGWTYRIGSHYITETISTADHPGRKWADTTPKMYADGNPWLDLGSGVHPAKDRLGVDPFVPEGTPNVRREDMRDLSWYREEFGLCPGIHSAHALEHIPYRDVPAMFREWFKTLKPGGTIWVNVPDGEKYLRDYVKYIDDGKDDTFEMTFIHNGLFGDETADGQVHQSIYTAKSLRALAETTGFVDVEVEVFDDGGIKDVMPARGHLVLTGKKPEDPKPKKKRGKK